MKQTIVATSSNHTNYEESCEYVWLRFIIQHVQETCDYPRERWNQQLEMANKPVPVSITRTRPRFDGESPL